jgi:hypothetical protein
VENCQASFADSRQARVRRASPKAAIGIGTMNPRRSERLAPRAGRPVFSGGRRQRQEAVVRRQWSGGRRQETGDRRQEAVVSGEKSELCHRKCEI